MGSLLFEQPALLSWLYTMSAPPGCGLSSFSCYSFIGWIKVVASHDTKTAALRELHVADFSNQKVIPSKFASCEILKKHMYASVHVSGRIECRWRFGPACTWLQTSSEGMRKNVVYPSLFDSGELWATKPASFLSLRGLSVQLGTLVSSVAAGYRSLRSILV